LVPKTTKLAFGFEILAPKILYEIHVQKTLMKFTIGQQILDVGKRTKQLSLGSPRDEKQAFFVHFFQQQEFCQ